MKPNIPWSVKGIDPDARSVAKELARKKGMTLGEWMTEMIREQGLDAATSNLTESLADGTISGVTTDQLRSVVETLNRLNERLQATEEVLQSSDHQSREAMGGLNKGLETVFERVKRLEDEAGTDDHRGDIAERLDKLEGATEKNSWVKSLVALEKALTTLVDQVEESRSETEQRLVRNEDLISALQARFDEEDATLKSEIAALLESIDATSDRVSNTETMVSEALDAARAAMQSRDESYVERTSQRLQLLGSEIKRTSDQIRTLESNVTRLSEKIEAGEERSAEGISRVAQSLESLRQQVQSESLNDGQDGSSQAVKEAVAEADRRIGALQGAFSSVVDRLEGRIAEASSRAHTDDIPDIALDNGPIADLRDPHESEEDEFDRVFDDPLQLIREPEPAPQPEDVPAPQAPGPQEPIFGAASNGFIAQSQKDGGTTFRELPPVGEAGTFSTEWNDPATFDPVDFDPAADQFRDNDAFAEPPTLIERIQSRLSRPFSDPVENNPQLGWVLIAIVVGAIMFAAFQITNLGRDEAPAVTRSSSAAPAPTDNSPSPVELYAAAKNALAGAVTRDEIDAGVNAMMRAARAGSAGAQHDLGEMYLNGEFVSADFAKAKQWFDEAANAGNARAIHRLAYFAIDERYGPQDVDAALRGFERAADAGLTDAMFNLGTILSPTMNYIPAERRDAAQSYYWFRLAELQGDPKAGEDANAIADKLDPQTRIELERMVARWEPSPISS
ncbi:MAG: hypothetical protein AAF788_03130 [Pseudomonadota bacterium]